MTFALPAQRRLLISCKNSHITSLYKDKAPKQRLPTTANMLNSLFYQRDFAFDGLFLEKLPASDDHQAI
jgi:hypothetical protein